MYLYMKFTLFVQHTVQILSMNVIVYMYIYIYIHIYFFLSNKSLRDPVAASARDERTKCAFVQYFCLGATTMKRTKNLAQPREHISE